MQVIKYKVFSAIAILMLALIISVGVFSFTAFASTGGGDGNDNQTLIVNAAWLDGEMIRLDVTDLQTGDRSSLAVPLSAYLKDGDNSEFISIQAVDANGKQSGVVEIKNPFYDPHLAQNGDNPDDNSTAQGKNGNVETQKPTEPDGSTSAIDNPKENTNQRPLTPDGTGTVIDNVTESAGKEFFTIYSEDGNEFFLIVDRERSADNVYLLNGVTEEDLMALAQKGGREVTSSGNATSAITTPAPSQPLDIDGNNNNGTTGTETPETETNERPSPLSRIGNNLMLFAGIIVVVGGIAYYVKIVKPKKDGYTNNFDDGDDEPDEFGYDEAIEDEEEGDED